MFIVIHADLPLFSSHLNSSLAQIDKAARTALLQPRSYTLPLPNWGYTLGTEAT